MIVNALFHLHLGLGNLRLELGESSGHVFANIIQGAGNLFHIEFGLGRVRGACHVVVVSLTFAITLAAHLNARQLFLNKINGIGWLVMVVFTDPFANLVEFLLFFLGGRHAALGDGFQ